MVESWLVFRKGFGVSVPIVVAMAVAPAAIPAIFKNRLREFLSLS